MNKGEQLFLAEAYSVVKSYNKLQVVEANGKAIISGELDLIDEQGNHHDTYAIEIHPDSNYPNCFPLVFEVGGRIPRNIDWHVFESDGHCCISTYSEEILTCKEGITLRSFLQDQVKPYFYSQTFRRLKGYFLKERSHGFLGDIEFFKEILKTNNILEMAEWLYFILQRKEPSRSEKECFCGKKIMYRKCHREAYRKLATFSDNELEFFIYRLKKLLDSHYQKNDFIAESLGHTSITT